MRTRLTLLLALVVVVTGGAWYHFHASTEPVSLVTAEADLGDIVQAAACTGTLDAVTAVDVGSQVSGTIAELDADFNSIVHKGQVLARLDTSLFQTQLDQARAALVKARADIDTASVGVIDATQKLDRARALAARQLIPQSDLDDANVAMNEARAAVRAAAAQKEQAQASIDQAQVNLAHSVITSPIDGIVIDRKVDVGQTVTANFQTPSLFSIAADLTKMEVKATVDEADIGRVKAGELAHFTVDAYPDDVFDGKVLQVRLQPQTVQNVVTYVTVIEVDNSRLQLKPGMTATVAIDVARHDGVVRVPGTALRFRPSQSVLAALHETGVASKTAVHSGTALVPGSVGEVWVSSNGRIEPRRVRVGLSDGQWTEVSEGVPAGARVVTSAMLTALAGRSTGPAPSPLTPTPAWRRF